MPLKHRTETWLVVLLGAAMAATGIVTSTLPPLPAGLVPWGVLLILSLAYPMLLYPLFRRDRADYAFRLLHWVPAALLLLWVLMQLFDAAVAGANLSSLFAWGWTLAGVGLGFLLLIAFCLRVIRRRVPRLTWLLLIFVPYAALGAYSQQGGHFEQQLAAQLWQGGWWQMFEQTPEPADDPSLVAQREESVSSVSSASSSFHNLAPSVDPQEEQWREQLRHMEERSDSVLVAAVSSASSASSASSTVAVDVPESLRPGGSGAHMREAKTMPHRLPQSGLPLGVMGITLLAAYCGKVHDRARRRV